MGVDNEEIFALDVMCPLALGHGHHSRLTEGFEEGGPPAPRSADGEEASTFAGAGGFSSVGAKAVSNARRLASISAGVPTASTQFKSTPNGASGGTAWPCMVQLSAGWRG